MNELYGFTFNGRHSSEFGIIVKSKNIPMLSQARTDYQSIPKKDGTYDFSDGTYDDRTISITCEFLSDDVATFRQRVRQIGAWLVTRNKVRLIFDDDNEIFYNVRIINQIDITQLAIIGEFTIEFKSDPFGYSVNEISEQATLNMATNNRMEITSYSTVNTPTTMIIRNIGTSAINGFSVKITMPKEA